MHEWQSLAHVRWECKYHVVFIPKYRRKVLYGRLRTRIGAILRELCRQRGIEVLEGHLMPDHVHMCLSIPPKYSVAHTIGFIKGKSAVRIHRQLLRERRMTGLHFWATGYSVSTVGLDEDRDYQGAKAGQRGSYFKPLEAYALKEQIEREAKKIEGYYATFAAAAKIGTGEDEDVPWSELPGGELGYDWETGRDKRSMANTYVWTADGGFYAEEEQFSSIRQESRGSSYHFLGQGL